MSGDIFLDLKEVTRRTRMSRTVIYERMLAGTFPLARKRGRQSVWVESEVQAVIDAEIATLPKMGLSMGARPRRTKKPLKSAA